jgi:hypothetical protein
MKHPSSACWELCVDRLPVRCHLGAVATDGGIRLQARIRLNASVFAKRSSPAHHASACMAFKRHRRATIVDRQRPR